LQVFHIITSLKQVLNYYIMFLEEWQGKKKKRLKNNSRKDAKNAKIAEH